MSALAEYNAGTITGLHAGFKIGIAFIGTANPLAGLILSAADMYFGEMIFGKPKQ